VLAQRHIDRIRATKKLDPLPDDPDVLSDRRAATPIDGRRSRFLEAMRQALAAAIAGLPPRDRLRLSCYYSQDLTLAAIGRLLKEHEATVSRNLARTRSEVRLAVEARLRADHTMDTATIADCIRSVTEDAGTLDLADFMGLDQGRKNAPDDRSRQ